MAKQDWAEQLLLRIYAPHDVNCDEYRARLLPLTTIATLLRAERARSRRVVRELRAKHTRERDSIYTNDYTNACDDILERL